MPAKPEGLQAGSLAGGFCLYVLRLELGFMCLIQHMHFDL